MSLISTPTDILTPILELVELEDLARLFCVGSRPLLRRLQQSRLIRSIRKDSEPTWLPAGALLRRNRSPMTRFSQLSFLAYFPRIEVLHLDFTGQNAVLDSPEAIFHLSLRSLVLKMRGGWELLWDTPNRCARTLNRFWPRMHTLYWADLKELDHRSCTDDAQRQVGKFLPKRIERLSLGNFARLPHLLIEALPPNILHLEITIKEWDKLEAWTKMPPLLQSLLVNSSHVGFSKPFTFPSPDMQSFTVYPGNAIHGEDWRRDGLHKIVTLDIPNSLLRVEDFVLLPRTLLTLIANKNSIRALLQPINNQCIAQLPRGLTFLDMKAPEVTSAAFSLLPKALTHLYCDYNVSRDLDIGISNIPPALTSFIYGGSTWKEEDEFLTELLPASLRKLDISYDKHFEVPHVPKALTALTYSTVIRMPPDNFAKLPQTLVSLSFDRGFAYSSPQSDELIFPPVLRELTITDEFWRMTEAIAQRLPKSLTFLHLSSAIKACCLPNLPPCLTYFYARTITPSAVVTKAIAADYEAALASRQTGYEGPILPFPNNQSDESGLMITSSDLIRRTEALMPRFTVNIGCDYFSIGLDQETLAPVANHLTGLDMTLRDWEIAPSIPAPKKEAPANMDPVQGSALPSLSPATNEVPTQSLASFSKKVSLPTEISLGLDASTSAILPRLQTLIIHSKEPCAIYASCSMHMKEYEALPTSLTRLDILDLLFMEKGYSADINTIGTEWVARLANLKHLRVARRFLNSSIFQYLPSCLETFIGSRSLNIPTDCFELLPRSLTHLECGSLLYTDPIAPRVAPFHLLPSTLKRVILHAQNVDVSGPCLALAQWSGRLGALSKAAQHWVSFLASAMARDLPIPSDLTSLDLDHMIITDKFFSSTTFPSSITSMSLKSCMNLTTDSVPYWPKSLTSAHIGSLAFTRALVLAGQEKPKVLLPVSISDEPLNDDSSSEEPLIETHSDSSSELVLAGQEEEPTDSSLFDEPLNEYIPVVEEPLIDASFDWNFILQQLSLVGPPNLTDLNVRHPGVSTDNAWPFALVDFKKLRWTCVDLPFNLGFDDRCMQLLPSSVTILRLPRCRGISPFGGRSLPKSLTELILSNWCPNDNSIAQLPAGLTKLEITPVESSLTDAAIKSLPKGLIDLNLATTPITDTSLPDFPSTLKRLKVQMIRLTGKMFRPAPAANKRPESFGATIEPLDFKTVTVATLIQAALDLMPCALEAVPTTEFCMEPFALITALAKNVEHIQLPAPQIDTFHVLKLFKPGVAYRQPLAAAGTGPTLNKPLAPLNSRPTAKIGTATAPTTRNLNYIILSPWNTSALKPALLHITWTANTSASVEIDQLPAEIKTFFCMHANLSDRDMILLPQSLRSLGLPDSDLSLTGLKDVPRLLKELHVKLADFNPSVQNLIEIINMKNDVGKRILELLPQNLQKVIWGGITYTGEDTCSLKRPSETDDIENAEN